MSIVSVAGSHDLVGESPVWHPQERCIYWVDINRFRIHRFSPAISDLHTWQFDEPVTTISLTTKDRVLLVATGGRLILWKPDKDERTDFVTVEKRWPYNRLNDGASGPDGNFWVGSMRNNIAPDGSELPISEETGSLYRITPDRQVTAHDTGFGITNTIAWNPAETEFYCGCSGRGVLYAYRYDRVRSEVSERRIFAEALYPGVPDGSAVDSSGVLWNCRHSGKCILAFRPDGTLLRKIDMPTTHVTNCVFGDDDLRTLYVTTASLGAPKGEPLAGNLLSLQMDVAGTAPYRFTL